MRLGPHGVYRFPPLFLFLALTLLGCEKPRAACSCEGREDCQIVVYEGKNRDITCALYGDKQSCCLVPLEQSDD